jgi:hypothetical protein
MNKTQWGVSGFRRHVLETKFPMMFRNQLDTIFRTKVHGKPQREHRGVKPSVRFEREGQVKDEYIVPEGQKEVGTANQRMRRSTGKRSACLGNCDIISTLSYLTCSVEVDLTPV